MIRPIISLLLASVLACNAFSQGLSYAPGRGPAGAAGANGAQGDPGPAPAGDADQIVTVDGAGGAQTAPATVTGAAFVYTPTDVDNFDVSFGGNLFSVHVTGGAAEFTFEGDSSFDGRTQGQYFRATESTADTNPVKYGWVSPDATLYGVEMRGLSGTRPHSIGLMTEGAMRAWFSYLGSNYTIGPHRFTGPLAPTLRLGASTQAVDAANLARIFAISDSDYTLPAVNTALYQGDGDGAHTSREFTIIRGNTTNPVAVIAAGTDKIHVQGSEVAAGLVTLSWIADAASIDLTEKGAGVRCQESYRRVSTGPDVFQAAWFCEALGLGIEVSP